MRLPEELHVTDNPHERWLLTKIREYCEKADAHEIQVTLNDDFHALKDQSDRLDKLPLTPYFDPNVSEINATNGFWLRGIDTEGDVVMQQAARLYNWHDTTAAIMHQTLHAFYESPSVSAEFGENCRCEAPATHFVTGKVCYHGELWIDPKLRGLGVTSYIARLMMAIVQLRWRPDYFIGFAQPDICTKGVAARYGYMNGQPHGIIWHVPSQGTLDEWLIWNSQRDLQAVLGLDAINDFPTSSDILVTDNTIGDP